MIINAKSYGKKDKGVEYPAAKSLLIEVKYREAAPIPDDSAICEQCGKAAAAMIITKEPGDYGVHHAPDGTKLTRIPAYAFLYLLGYAEKNEFLGKRGKSA